MPTGGPSPGFQGTETSGAEITVYSVGDDPIVFGSSGALPIVGRYRQDADHALVACNTQKIMGQAGQFSFTVKPARGVTDTLFERIVDDDWVDIVFRRHGRVWHTMRGTVDNVSRQRTVGGAGATQISYTITGRDHQKQFELTPLWFNKFTHENLAGSASYRVYSIAPTLGGDPAETVQAFLISWMQELEGIGRANWPMPDTLPNTLGNFIEDIQRGFVLDGFSGVPSRVSINPNFMEPNGTLWSLAQEWGDPGFCELWCDLGKNSAQLGAGEECTLDESTLSVFFRDRPFPLSRAVVDENNQTPTGLGLGRDSAWFSLPLHVVPRQQVIADTVQRSGTERLNAFFVSPQLTQEFCRLGRNDLLQPLWSSRDIYRHGLRRYDIMTHYKHPQAKLLTISAIQRHMARDWYAINPYLMNGTINLAVGRPEIRVGTRVRIPGDAGETTLDETYYVEGVSNDWVFGQGIRTGLNVTRGWIGDDDSLMDAVETLVDEYAQPEKMTPRAASSEALV
ncbi:MAG: hypothetical protein JSU89_15680 [Myxococcales bacterium]|nr:MAG: hypothetical protein JSU89_15680 [Myxococcales bacterium]